MEKLKMHTPDATEANMQRLRQLFPNCVTEIKDAKGQPKLAVDFDLLKQELSNSIIEGPQERYHLNWPGKREALFTANAPIAKTMRPSLKESVNFDATANIFIEGDNLEALKLLQETYLGKVKMIYIDPPYNTGSDFIYNDDFSENAEDFLTRSNQKDELGNNLLANTASNGRFHSDWLSMVYARLKLARNLLKDDGVIIISIDDNEVDNLKSICSEIFGEQNFIGCFVVNSTPNARDYGHIGKMHEYALFYAKNALEAVTFELPSEDKTFRFQDETGNFNIHPLYNSNVAFHKDNRPNLYYPFYVDETKRSADGFFEITLEKRPGLIEIYPPKSVKEGVQFVWRWGKELAQNNLNKEITGYKTEEGEFRIVQKMRHTTKLIRSLLLDKAYSSRRGTAEVEELFGKKIFSFPKPVKLIKDFVQATTKDNDIVLDFFAGSGSTAHAVMEMNAEDGGNRKFIAVQLPEKCEASSDAAKAGFTTIAEICKERIRRAGKKIADNTHHAEWNKDTGFRVLKIDTSNMADIYYAPDGLKQNDLLAAINNIKPDRTPEDLLLQVMLDLGIDLSLPISTRNIKNKTIFSVNGNQLVACFDTGITEDMVKELATSKPQRMIFRDNGFISDSVKINAEQIFRQLSPSTEVKSI